MSKPFPAQTLIPPPITITSTPEAKGIHLGGNCYWDPYHLPNPHVVVLGASGSGKTQTLKALAYELSRQGSRVVMIDFHGDQSLPGETVYPLNQASPYGINPLIVNPDPEGGGPDLQAIQVAWLLRKTLNLGPLQEGTVLGLLKSLYREAGIVQGDPGSWKRDPPTFADLEKALQNSQCGDHLKLQVKLATTFSYGIFSRQQPTFRDPLIRLDVSKLPPELGAIAGESLAQQVMNEHRLSGESPPKTFLFIDEAKEMRGGRSLDRIIADGRKYGLGLILASQSERHLSKEILANSATKVVLAVDQTEVRSVSRKFRFAEEKVAALKPLQALVRLGQEARYTEIYPYFQRAYV